MRWHVHQLCAPGAELLVGLSKTSMWLCTKIEHTVSDTALHSLNTFTMYVYADRQGTPNGWVLVYSPDLRAILDRWFAHQA